MNAITMTIRTASKNNSLFRLSGIWLLYALLLVFAPKIFSTGGSLSLLSTMGTVIIFGLAYNMLLGQGGMLSFGHAVYSGLGAFFAIHAMNLAAGGALWIPVWLVPLVGGVAGMLFGALFGYVTTKKSGTTFAMITLGIVEMVFAASLMFPGFFGGEGGITTDRVYGQPLFGMNFGPQIQVYYLIAAWLFIATIAMYAFTQTPLGRIINAVRDNPERAEFIGYDTQWTRYLVLVLSSFFAGISGGLSAINFEIVSAENVSAAGSGAILLFTFIGGVGYFFGPIIGAIIGVFLTVMLSEFTNAWRLYLGIFFIAVVMYAPGGIAGIVSAYLRVMAHQRLRRILPALAAVSCFALIALLGFVASVEMLYHLTLESARGTTKPLFGIVVDTASAWPWVVSAGVLLCGAIGCRKTYPAFAHSWSEVNAEIEELLTRGT